MIPLYVYQNGTRGDVMLARAIYRAVIASGQFDVTIGACRGDEMLLGDLVGPRCRLVTSEFANTAHGAPLDLAALCPRGVVAIEAKVQGPDQAAGRQWPEVVESFHRALRRHGIGVVVADPEGEVPMLDFEMAIDVPKLRRPAIYVDAERSAERGCYFVFDFERLAGLLPDWDLLCTNPRGAKADNLVDIRHLTWPQRSRISEQCVALVGLTCDPFAVTLTAANRWKPKALCGYDARLNGAFWDYPGNPAELLATMDELVDFLLANVVEGAVQ